MANNTEKDYKFAIGRKIKQVFIESELYLDGKNNGNLLCEKLSVRRIDTPLFILLDNDVLLRLYGTSLTVADDYAKEFVFGDGFASNDKSQKEFERLCGLTITDIEGFYKNKYDLADDEGNILTNNDEFQISEGLTDLAVVFDSGLRLVCYTFLDYFDIEIVEKQSKSACCVLRNE